LGLATKANPQCLPRKTMDLPAANTAQELALHSGKGFP
jgi:hypothetical protein